MLSAYTNEIEKLPSSLHNVAGVLFCMVSSVDSESAFSSTPEVIIQDDHRIMQPNQYISYDEKFARRQELPITGTNTTFSSFFREISEDYSLRKDILLVNRDDFISYNILSSVTRSSKSIAGNPDFSARIDKLMVFEKQAMLRNQIYRLISEKNGLPLYPQESLVERSIKESELLTFTPLNAAEFYKFNQLVEMDKILYDCATPLPNFTGLLRKMDGEDGSVLKRRYFRNLNASAFAQVLTAERCRDPQIVRKYYPLSDQLLFVLCWPPPDRRMKRESWTLIPPKESIIAHAESVSQPELTSDGVRL